MARSSDIYFSKLAPEDKRFIKRVGFYLFCLLLLSGLGLYVYTYLKEEDKIPDLANIAKYPENFSDLFADSASKPAANEGEKQQADSSDAFELPAAPDFPEFVEHSPGDLQETAKDSIDEDFDAQAHYELMRQNAAAFNYKKAYKHGARIEQFLLASASRSEEWGHILLETGLPKEALAALQKLNDSDSLSADGIVDLAFAMLRSGEPDSAAAMLDDKLRGKASALLLAAKAAVVGEHSDTTKRAAADALFNQALKLEPASDFANYYYGRYLMQRGDFLNSRKRLELAAKAKPSEPRYIARLGMAEFYLKQDAKAEALYKKALEMNPHDYNTWFNIGELYLSQANESNSIQEIKKKTRMALESYLEAVSREPLHSNAHFRIGLILNGNGGYGEAIKHLNIAIEKMPSNISIMQQLSAAHLQLQDTAKSVEYLEKILQIDPFNKIAASEFRRIRSN